MASHQGSLSSWSFPIRLITLVLVEDFLAFFPDCRCFSLCNDAVYFDRI